MQTHISRFQVYHLFWFLTLFALIQLSPLSTHKANADSQATLPPHPACILELAPLNQELISQESISFESCHELSQGQPFEELAYGIQYHPYSEEYKRTFGYFIYRIAGYLTDQRAVLHTVYNGGGSGTWHNVLVIRGLDGHFGPGDVLELESVLERGDRCKRGIDDVITMSGTHSRVTEFFTPARLPYLHSAALWFSSSSLSDCMICCMGAAVYEFDHTVMPPDLKGRLIEVHLPSSGTPNRMHFINNLRSNSGPTQHCLLDLIDKRRSKESSPTNLVLTSEDYDALVMEFDKTCQKNQ